MCSSTICIRLTYLDVFEEDVCSEGAVRSGGGHFCWGHIHALKVVPCCAVGLHNLG